MMSDDLDPVPPLPDGFSGPVRLFPLPNLVLFPQMVQPLHVFEPRYRTLFEEALATDRLMAMALLRPGWEPDYEGRPPIHAVACLGRVVTYRRLPDGRYNCLVAGMRRVAVVRELPPAKVYREAEIELVADRHPAGDGNRGQVRNRLMAVLKGLVKDVPQAAEQVERLLASSLALGTLVDLVASTSSLDCAVKQQLLEELRVDRRAKLLLKHLDPQQRRRKPSAFPPDFSAN
jgi:Lon protease-like protein